MRIILLGKKKCNYDNFFSSYRSEIQANLQTDLGTGKSPFTDTSSEQIELCYIFGYALAMILKVYQLRNKPLDLFVGNISSITVCD